MTTKFFLAILFLLKSLFIFSVPADDSPVEQNQSYLVLITGCGRSGTTYTAELLQKAGLDVQHEGFGQDGSVSWFLAGEIPQSKGIHFEHVFHQVRDPLQVIPSVETFKETSWQYICHIIPEIKMTDPLIVRATKYWIYWNLMAEAHAEWTYRIEDISLVFKQMSKRLNRKLNKQALNLVPQNTNTRKHRELTWQQLKTEVGKPLYRQVKELALKYGYDVNE